jgi:predicted nuclease of predicted toxin-antitoxin system
LPSPYDSSCGYAPTRICPKIASPDCGKTGTILWIREAAPGISDTNVLARAHTENRLLITFDKDFGELVFHRGAKSSHGIVLFRIGRPSAAVVAARVAAVLASRDDWSGHFSVVEDFAVRMRPLPDVQQ